MKIGFIGLGIMGSRMALNLLSKGFNLTIYNRNPSKATDLLQQGAKWADSPALLAKDVDVLITMLAHPEAVEAVAHDDKTGFLSSLKQGAIWIDCSTVNPDFAQRMATLAQSKGIRFLDAPVAGSKNQAQEAQLIFFIGGETEDIHQCRPIFEAMGKLTNHVGEHGMGNALKLVLNHMLATSMLAFAEGLVFGESLGLSQEKLLNTLIGSAVAPPYLAGKRAKIETDSYDTEFPLRWMQKDLQMVSETAFQTGVAMSSANIAKEIFQLAIRYGYGDDDFSAIYAFLKQVK